MVEMILHIIIDRECTWVFLSVMRGWIVLLKRRGLLTRMQNEMMSTLHLVNHHCPLAWTWAQASSIMLNFTDHNPNRSKSSISKNTKSRNSCEHNLPLDIAAPVSPRWTQHIIFSSLCSVFYSYLAACGNGKSSVRPLPLTYIVVSKTLK